MSDRFSFPSKYAAYRSCTISASVSMERYGALTENWKHSADQLKSMTACFEKAKLPGEVRTVAVAGSLGRMEAADKVSDCDLLVVLNDDIDLGSADASQLYDAVWKQLEPLNLAKPKKTGTFAEPTTQRQLCDKGNVGAPDEDMRVFAKRLLLLLETQPVYRADEYDKLVHAVVDCYAEGYVAKDARKEWGFLINDLIRYFRSICVNYQWDFSNEHGKWPLRNAKLRHSRLIMYGGLLLLLGECSLERDDKVGWLKERLRMTPLERIEYVYRASDDACFFRIAGFYDTFLTLMNSPDVRHSLNVEAKGESYPGRYKIPNYAILKTNSDGLVAELVRFVLARDGYWSERFFEYLLF
jgi:hypothetical protein